MSTTETPRIIRYIPPMQKHRIVLQGEFGEGAGRVTINHLALTIEQAEWMRDELTKALKEALGR